MGVMQARGGLAGRVERLGELLGKLCPCPKEWLTEGTKGSTAGGQESIECVECQDYRKLVMSWRKAMKWTDGLDHALTVMLAAIASTKAVGDQLWVKVIGPAACGKSTLCEAISTNKRYVLAKSTIRGFHSGYKTDGAGEEDNSLVALLFGKTLVTKDGDTLLQSPNLSQILSEARDLYDSTSRTHYRNTMSKDYEGVRMTWLLCGTSSLRSIDQSELGERFLDCVIMEGIDDDLEDEILWRVANRAEKNVGIETDGKLETQYEPELSKAMSLTGGYVDYLRENASQELGLIEMDREAKIQCMRLGKFVSHMRARPSQHQEETAERELGARLVSQLIRLAKCTAFVLNKRTIDTSVMDRVRRVALDTSRGQTLNIVHTLAKEKSEGRTSASLGLKLNRAENKVRTMLRFLRKINAVEQYTPKNNRVRWRLTKRMAKLYGEVIDYV